MNLKARIIGFIYFLLCDIALLSIFASAYIDPGLTMMLTQFIAGAFITLGIVFGIWRRKIIGFFKRTGGERKKLKEGKPREKSDVDRFNNAEKELVVYAESGNYYRYFERCLNYILENSDIVIHYLTGDISDPVFDIANPQFKAYYCSDRTLVSVMMKLDCKIMLMTMPDLDVYHYKRSKVNNEIEYIYAHHGQNSLHSTMSKNALDNYDTIFCYSKNHNEEIRAMERAYGLPEKKLVNTGYGLLDTLIESYEAEVTQKKEPQNPAKTANAKPQILIAPSWQKDNLLDYCLNPLLQELFKADVKIIIRPHPEYIKRHPARMTELNETYKDKLSDNFEIHTDIQSNSVVYSSDVIITDWSSIAQEFSFTTKKPAVFINTPMKIMNPEWEKVGIEPMDVWIRDKIGISLNPDSSGEPNSLDRIGQVVRDMLDNADKYRDNIVSIMNEYLYNPGHSGEAGGSYIIDRIEGMRGK